MISVLLACLLSPGLTYQKAVDYFPNIVKSAEARAKKQDKNVFVVVGAKWCVACHELWNDLKLAPFSKVMDGSYVALYMDLYDDVGASDPKSVGGRRMADSWVGKTTGGIPYYVVLDPLGKVLATSFVHKANMVGLTSSHGDLFVKILRRTAKHSSKADIDAIQSWIDQPPN